jgi:peptidoglycan/xylan/chitin deacetylase (PgdA/CDA1 family)
MCTRIAIILSLSILTACGDNAATGEQADGTSQTDGWEESDGASSGESREEPEHCKPDGYTLAKDELCFRCNPAGNGLAGEGEKVDDGNPCTDDSCDIDLGVVHAGNSEPCNDGDAGTWGDTCSGGVCVGNDPLCEAGAFYADGSDCFLCAPDGSGPASQPQPIDDGNPCTDDACTAHGGLKHTSNSDPCDDGDPDTYDDVCKNSVCVGEPLACTPGAYFTHDGDCLICNGEGSGGEGSPISDGNVCTDDLCDSVTGLVHVNNDIDCDDGDPNTIEDTCAEGECQGIPLVCAPGDWFEDGGLCWECADSGLAVEGAGEPIDDENLCTDDLCDANDGVVNSDNTLPCDDGDPDTVNDQCFEGDCEGVDTTCDEDEYFLEEGNCKLCDGDGMGPVDDGIAVDDGNLCTDDECDPDDGVVNAPNSDKCDDGDPETIDDKCVDGTCMGEEILCPKGNYYLQEDLCFLCNGDGTGPVGAGAEVPDDGNECTADICDAGNGVEHQELWGTPCDDGDGNTAQDECDAGVCVGEPVICIPGTWISNDDYACYLCIDEGTDLDDDGVKISDSNDCTDDACDLDQGVTHTFNFGPCSDGNSDTVNDTCNGAGVCVGGDQVCPPGNYYLDGALCYLCDGDGAGPVGPGAPIPDDGNECTEDICDAGNGVEHQELWGDPCDDGDDSTALDECEDGICVGEPIICLPGTWLSNDDYACYLCIDEGTDLDDNGVKISDSNGCTEDVCDPIDGVVHTALEGDCWDSNDCTLDDMCVAGECVGTPVDCNDYSPCTTDACVDEVGCTHANIEGPCDDGIALTLDDVCIDGICIGMVDPDGDGIPNYGPGGPCDGPGTLDNCVDNCPYRANADQVDADNDGQGNACETPRWWTRVDTTEKVVALTFDDGWSEDALKGILKALGEKGARGSFFIAGVYMEDGVLTAEVIKQGINGGHVFGNHTYSHSVGANLGETVAEINQASATFENLVGDDLRPIYRHPYAELVPWINIALVQTGFLESVLGNFDSEDWTDPEPDPQLLADCIVAMTEPGDIIGFHVGPDATVAALPAIIDGLHAKGFTLLNIEQMMAYGPPVIVDISEIKSCSSYWDGL